MDRIKLKHTNQLEIAQNEILDPTKISRYMVAADDVYSSDSYYMEVLPGSLSSSHMRHGNEATLYVYLVPRPPAFVTCSTKSGGKAWKDLSHDAWRC